MSDVELEAFYKEHLEESIIKQLSKQENISLDEAMNLYYNSKLANYIHEGKYDIQYLDYKVLTYYLIKELQTIDFVPSSVNPEPLMDVFKKMIIFQLQAENDRVLGLRPSTHNYDGKYKKIKEIPQFEFSKEFDD